MTIAQNARAPIVTSGVAPSPARARSAFRWACALDVATAKPGNVSLTSPGHGMQAAMFTASAEAAATALFASGTRVGTRIEGAMRASLAAAGCNTNLGIVLLAAPLAAAFERVDDDVGAGELRRSVADVLAALDIDDAAAAFRAIAATNPGGLGRAQAHDVAEPAKITLREAMVLAASRDRVAHQYASSFADVFDTGLATFLAGHDAAEQRGFDAPAAAGHAMLGAFLELLARHPDSHIARRHGDTVAHSVMVRARAPRDAWRSGLLIEADAALASWDRELKHAGINPGTTADLCVACAMVAAWLHPSLDD